MPFASCSVGLFRIFSVSLYFREDPVFLERGGATMSAIWDSVTTGFLSVTTGFVWLWKKRHPPDCPQGRGYTAMTVSSGFMTLMPLLRALSALCALCGKK